MKLSVVLAVRNEAPTLFGTLYSFWEDLTTWIPPGEFELVVVDNCGSESPPAPEGNGRARDADLLLDKFRRWVRHGWLKVIKFDDRPGNVVARNVGARAASGDVVIFADGHLSIAHGATRLLYEGAAGGGVWHPAFNMWGDTSDIRCHGYDLQLKEKFWGNISRRVPVSVPRDSAGRPAGPYLVPMASHCCLAVRRDEFLDLGGYGETLRVYGGGEPLLDMKYWVLGSTVNMEPRALVRHCSFGVATQWRESGKDEQRGSPVLIRRGGDQGAREFSKDVKKGDRLLKYARDYAWTNEDLHHNFMAAAYIVGGYAWLQRMYDVFWRRRWGEDPAEPDAWRYLVDLNRLRREVLAGCAEERAFVQARAKRSLDDLLASPPWPE